MILKAFKVKVLFKLYKDLKADYELTIGENEKAIIFFNNISVEYCNVFVQKQKKSEDDKMNSWNSSKFVTQQTNPSLNNADARLLKKENI